MPESTNEGPGARTDASGTAGSRESSSGKPIGRVADFGRDIGRDIGQYIRQQRTNAKISLRQLAKRAGVSNPYLSQIERGVRKPSAEILQQIAKGLRISAEALYVQAGILDTPSGGPVPDAIRADTELTERQKQVLLDIYHSFRRENAAKQDQHRAESDKNEE
ncbi:MULTISPECIES: helix-turn-helix transcriptional regulator [Thermocrispum]|jgi:transcriptional regulator with XRE-family HTH domain|uniref:Helix-turn-helix transcriptional regulator n=1 Tax=Thermocrispum agreste TaxID=37925 RepID=A0ABD6FJK4_9PSEU|nr:MULTISPECIES: helix-turn-helix transcriptional regulator [Thermocrispum]